MDNLVIQSKAESVVQSRDRTLLQSSPRAFDDSEISWMIGGPQGSGVDSASTLFAIACAKGGYSLFGKREYYSNIKGEPSHFQIMVSNKETRSIIDGVHILVTFDKRTLDDHIGEVIPRGTVVYDPSLVKVEREDVLKCPISYSDLLIKLQKALGQDRRLSSLSIMKNTIAVGASFGILGYDLNLALDAVSALFRGRRAELVAMNQVALRIGYEAAIYNITSHPHFRLPLIGSPRINRKKDLPHRNNRCRNGKNSCWL